MGQEQQGSEVAWLEGSGIRDDHSLESPYSATMHTGYLLSVSVDRILTLMGLLSKRSEIILTLLGAAKINTQR
jgi:hypothetical protein